MEQNLDLSDKNPIETDTDFCNVHPDIQSSFICDACSYAFCPDCPKRYAGTIRTCPYCGGMCRSLREIQTKKQKEIQIKQNISKGFGFEDFAKSLAYPFKFKTSLIFGGILFAFFSYGQSAASIGAIYLFMAAIICYMLANALSFGVLANTINNFSKGLTGKNFMPDFDEFDTWDDVIQPFFLSIAVWISSFGLLIALIFGAVWYGSNSFSDEVSNSTPASVQSINHVKEVAAKMKKQNEAITNLEAGKEIVTETQKANSDDEGESQKVNALINNIRKEQLESSVGKTPETQKKEYQVIISKFMKSAGIFLFLAAIAFIWGIFYFPAACIVAGYTRSFSAAINPLVGLDTIKHLGLDYVKIVLIFIFLIIVSAIIGSVLASLFSPFELPMFGNLPAKVIGSFVTFYFSIVFAVTLGFAIYKNSDKLKLFRS